MIGFGLRRVYRAVTVAVAIMGVSLVFAGGAAAFTEPGYTETVADFSNCAVPVIVNGPCFHAYVRGGWVQVGHATVPISIPGDTFDFGIHTNHSGIGGEVCEPLGPIRPHAECVLAGGHGLLNGPAQPVPGGLLGSIGNVQLAGVQAKLEWASSIPAYAVIGQSTEEFELTGRFPESPYTVYNQASLLDGFNSPGIVLTAKIHLLSPFLGANCYIGSASSPIVLGLTTGATNPPPPNVPIHGSFGHVNGGNNGIFRVGLMQLVDNAFSVPAASGCGTSGGGLLDGAIDRKLGLPSLAGHNSALIFTSVEFANASELSARGWTGE
jgi:hypothetical protein